MEDWETEEDKEEDVGWAKDSTPPLLLPLQRIDSRLCDVMEDVVEKVVAEVVEDVEVELEVWLEDGEDDMEEEEDNSSSLPLDEVEAFDFDCKI